MAKKRRTRNQSGSVYPTQSGNWKVAYWVQNLDGSKKRIYRNAKSEAHGHIILKKLRSQYETLHGDANSIRLSEIIDRWLAQLDCEQSTKDNYEIVVNARIVPHLGKHSLRELTPMIVEQWLKEVAPSTGIRTRQVAYDVLNRSLKYAVKIQVLDSNPCKGASRPTVKRKRIIPFTQTERDAILKSEMP